MLREHISINLLQKLQFEYLVDNIRNYKDNLLDEFHVKIPHKNAYVAKSLSRLVIFLLLWARMHAIPSKD